MKVSPSMTFAQHVLKGYRRVRICTKSSIPAHAVVNEEALAFPTSERFGGTITMKFMLITMLFMNGGMSIKTDVFDDQHACESAGRTAQAVAPRMAVRCVVIPTEPSQRT
jgi:hypothetical protein